MKRKYTMKEMHNFFLEMLREFHEFCVANQLTYYMVGGTLLGAVRDKGFIKWDDDVDVAMPRSDYERFLKMYNGNMFVISHHTEHDYSYPYAKLLYKKMPVVSVCDEEFDIDSKTFLSFDIYPIDGLGSDMKKAKKLVRRVEFYKKLLYINVTDELSQNIVKAMGARVIRKYPTKKLLTKIDAIMQSYAFNKSKYVTRWRVPTLENIVDKDVFGTPGLLDFETLKLNAPAEYKMYLERVYGDYKTPKKENQYLRHDVHVNAISKRMAEKWEREYTDETVC